MRGSHQCPAQRARLDFTDPFLRDITRAIRHLYPETLREAQLNYHEPEVLGIWRHTRRAKIEGASRSIAMLHGHVAGTEQNRSGDNHTVIESGRFLLTISRVEDQSEVPRRAQFRQEHAIHNQPLFAAMEESETEQNCKFSVILIHGPSPRDSQNLGFVLLRFPTPSGKGWLSVSLNLLALFAENDEVREGFSEEIIPDSIDPEIRTDQPRREEA